MTLHTTINELASTFAHDLLRAFRKASLQDILAFDGGAQRGPATAGAPKPRSGKRHRRTAADIGKTVDQIIAVVKGSKQGISAEGIRHALNVPRKELPKPIAMALASKKIRKSGKRRSTMYFA